VGIFLARCSVQHLVFIYLTPFCIGSSLIRSVRKCHKGVINSRKSQNRQYNDQKKKDRRINNDLQITTEEPKNWATPTPLKTTFGSFFVKNGLIEGTNLLKPFYSFWTKSGYYNVRSVLEIRAKSYDN
jgi:hypothetical protein